jgi:hypothetical protein
VWLLLEAGGWLSHSEGGTGPTQNWRPLLQRIGRELIESLGY